MLICFCQSTLYQPFVRITIIASGRAKTVKNSQTTKGCSSVAAYAFRMERGSNAATNSNILTDRGLEVRKVYISRRTPKSSQVSLFEPASKISLQTFHTLNNCLLHGLNFGVGHKVLAFAQHHEQLSKSPMAETQLKKTFFPS